MLVPNNKKKGGFEPGFEPGKGRPGAPFLVEKSFWDNEDVIIEKWVEIAAVWLVNNRMVIRRLQLIASTAKTHKWSVIIVKSESSLGVQK
ncbi:hypothetical protein CEXT_660891 [Caerostris extrusa]|uniref:Uncharacterized protein n=1 Tax=Caerostris extrusa TaxID=172846 RepID=A0AAV4MY40_CAEEX|nr:hypothetical protein CEXT_660891 [Caerostris extrusa]